MIMVASVARNGDTRRLAMTQPLASPTIAEKRMAATKITGIMLSDVARNAVAKTATVAINDATERSRPRTKMANVCPSTTIPRGAAIVSTFKRFPGRKNAGEASAANPSITTKNASSA